MCGRVYYPCMAALGIMHRAIGKEPDEHGHQPMRESLLAFSAEGGEHRERQYHHLLELGYIARGATGLDHIISVHREAERHLVYGAFSDVLLEIYHAAEVLDEERHEETIAFDKGPEPADTVFVCFVGIDLPAKRLVFRPAEGSASSERQ